MFEEFKNKVLFVTGAASGMGRAVAVRFGGLGCKVAVAARRPDAGAETVRLVKEAGGDAMFVPCDVADEAAVRAMVAKAIETFGKIDILVNNAGIFRAHYQPFKDQISAYWKQKIEINILGTMYCTHAVMPGMMERRYGRIINVSSVAGVYGLRNMVDYSMTKGAVIAFTKALAKELGPSNITVNAVAPGNISTYSELPELSFLGRSGTAEECANVITFLASDEASFVSGQNYQVDGCRRTM